MMCIKKIVAAVLLLAVGCIPEDTAFVDNQNHPGYVPVYADANAREIVFESPRTIHAPGKIYVYEKYLLINEQNAGIHVYNNEDPSHPVAVGFIRILGNYDMAVKNNVLYAGHLGNISAINLNGFNDLHVNATLTLDEWNYGVAPPQNSYFECPDPSKGTVIEWQYVQSKKFDCYAIR